MNEKKRTKPMLQNGGIYVIANVYAYDGQASKAKLLFTFLYIFLYFLFS